MKPLAYIIDYSLIANADTSELTDLRVLLHSLSFGDSKLLWFIGPEVNGDITANMRSSELPYDEVYRNKPIPEVLDKLYRINTYREDINENYKVIAAITADHDDAELWKSLGLTVLTLT